MTCGWAAVTSLISCPATSRLIGVVTTLDTVISRRSPTSAPGRPVLFDLAGSVKLRTVAERWAGRVDVCALPRTSGPAALLVRPDGYVAWATDDEPDTADPDALAAALRRWFGPPCDQGL